MLNLSATYIVESYWNELSSLLPYTNVLIGNETEATALGKQIGVNV